jgi:hypothetical protein
MLRGVIAAGLLMGLVVLGTAPAGDASAERPEQRGDGGPVMYYYSILPADCHMVTRDQAALDWHAYGDAFYISSYHNDTITVQVPVHLPHNAVVKSFSVFVTDNDSISGHTISCTLARLKFSDGTLGIMAYNGTSTLASLQNRRYLIDKSIDSGTVNNYTYGYFIYIHFAAGAANLIFHSARISYTL